MYHESEDPTGMTGIDGSVCPFPEDFSARLHRVVPDCHEVPVSKEKLLIFHKRNPLSS